jgi:uncharacterized protein YbaA (DUF1428 family)
MGKNLDLSKWKDSPAAWKYRKIIHKAERLVKVHGGAEDVEAAADELKKALIMNWDNAIIEKMKSILTDAIDDMEEEDKC